MKIAEVMFFFLNFTKGNVFYYFPCNDQSRDRGDERDTARNLTADGAFTGGARGADATCCTV